MVVNSKFVLSVLQLVHDKHLSRHQGSKMVLMTIKMILVAPIKNDVEQYIYLLIYKTCEVYAA